MIFIIADDLTGANDTGVQFAKNGFETRVLIPDKDDNYPDISEKQIDVLVYDTETRNINEKKARVKLRKLVKLLDIDENNTFYKKIDSTLRGNIGAEIEELMEALNKDICLITPSFPENNRITIDGYLFANKTSSIINKKIKCSEIKDEMKNEADYVPFILKKQTNFTIGHLGLKDIKKGKKYILSKIKKLRNENKKIIIVDSFSDRHLKNIIEGSISLKDSILYAGSAGLAGQLSQYLQKSSDYVKKELFNNNCLKDKSSFLIVGGTRKKILFNQIEYLKNKAECNLNIIDIDVNKIVYEETAGGQYLNSLTKFQGEDYQHIVVRPDPVFNDQKIIDEILSKKNMCFRELELLIREFLGKLTKKIIVKNDIKNIIVTGGDTALGICNYLNTQSLKVVDELLPGVPLNIIKILKGKEMNLITKAGDFGNEETLYEIITKMNNF